MIRLLQVMAGAPEGGAETFFTRLAIALQTRGIRVNEDASFVGIGRDERITFSEVFGLYSNTTDIIPNIHSTDTHGTNEVNFALLYLCGYQFAPRYRDFKKRVISD